MELGICPGLRPKKGKPKIKKKKPLPQQPEALSLFKVSDAEKSTGNFSREALIGKCILGLLYKAVLKDGSPVVVKRGLSGPRRYSSQVHLTNELRILTTLRSDPHNNYPRLIGFSDHQTCGETLLMIEYPIRGTLFDLLHQSDPGASPICFPLRIHLAFQAAKCVKMLHYRYEIAHMDLRSANFWIDKDWNVKLANFGAAIDIPWRGQMPGCPLGSLGMLDPGWPQEGYLAAKGDVFCFGIVLAEIMSNKREFDVRSLEAGDLMSWVLRVVRRNQMVEMVDLRARISPEHLIIPRELGRIAALCLQPSSRMRPTMSDVLERLRPLTQKFPFRR